MAAAVADLRALAALEIRDHHDAPLPENSTLLHNCRAGAARRLRREFVLPELIIDPLTPLPLADAVLPVPTVRLVYLLMASRTYAHETINRNVRALQRPGALSDLGSNESNLFIVHADDKLGVEGTRTLHAGMEPRPDVYFLRRPRPVMWAGWSMVLVLLDTCASLLARGLRFEFVINLSDADLTMRVDGEIRAFLARYPQRTIMSIVKRKQDSKRYKMHERFRTYCWTECEHGSGFLVSRKDGGMPSAHQVMGAHRCCWSRTAPLVYTSLEWKCPNDQMPEVYHGSQWAAMHYGFVKYMIENPLAQRAVAGFENTLLPDEAFVQTVAVNSPMRSTVIPSHLRYIEWPQMHGNPNKYWEKVGHKFHGGPMVMDEELVGKALHSPAMFARKFDPELFPRALGVWDRWMDAKLLSQGPASGQPGIGSNLIGHDPMLNKGLPPPTVHESGNSTLPRLPWPRRARDDAGPLDGIESTLHVDAQPDPRDASPVVPTALDEAMARALRREAEAEREVGHDRHVHGMSAHADGDERHVDGDERHVDGHVHSDSAHSSAVDVFILLIVGLSICSGIGLGLTLIMRGPSGRLRAWLMRHGWKEPHHPLKAV